MIYMQTLTHMSVGILILALYQMSSLTILFLNMMFPTYPHGYYSRKFSLHCCVLNTAAFFFHGLEKYNPDKWLVPIGHHPILLQSSSAMSRPSPLRQFPAGLQASSSCGLPKHPPPVGFLSTLDFFISCLSVFEGDPYRN